MKTTTKGDEKRAIGYVRVSTKDQALSPGAQRAAIEAYCAREGIELVEVHMDEGVCSVLELDDRPGLIAAMAGLRIHGAGLLVILRRDRLARDSYLAAVLDRAVEQSGARVVTADGVANDATPSDKLLRTILDAVAAYERELIRARTKAGLAQLKASGLAYSGRTPFGYRREGDRLERDERDMAVLEQVRAWREQGLSLRDICARLENAGVKPKNATYVRQGVTYEASWHPGVVQRMLAQQ